MKRLGGELATWVCALVKIPEARCLNCLNMNKKKKGSFKKCSEKKNGGDELIRYLSVYIYTYMYIYTYYIYICIYMKRS
jgi:hypothetical protein